MHAVRIRRHLDSDTLHLPELKALVGRNVEIIVLEEERSKRSMEAFFSNAGKIDIDESAIDDLRAKSKL